MPQVHYLEISDDLYGQIEELRTLQFHGRSFGFWDKDYERLHKQVHQKKSEIRSLVSSPAKSRTRQRSQQKPGI